MSAKGKSPREPLVTLAAGALQLSPAIHGSGKILKLNSLTGHTLTLPPSVGSGVRFTMWTIVAPTSNSNIIKVQNSTDVMIGSAMISLATGVGTIWPTGATSDTLTANRTTSGGASNGEWVELIDIAAGFWSIMAELNGSGVLVSPFSATV